MLFCFPRVKPFAVSRSSPSYLGALLQIRPQSQSLRFSHLEPTAWRHRSMYSIARSVPLSQAWFLETRYSRLSTFFSVQIRPINAHHISHYFVSGVKHS